MRTEAPAAIAGVVLLVAGALAWRHDRLRLTGPLLALFGGAALVGALLAVLAGRPSTAAPARVVVVLVLALVGLGYVVLTLFLVVNGLMMVRREGRSLGNLLSLVLGVGLALAPWLAGSLVAEVGARWDDEGHLASAFMMLFVLGLAAYTSFLFLSFLLSLFAFRRLPADWRPEAVIVLGSGLIGSRVPRLLAARLEAGRQVWEGTGRSAAIIPSGGKGRDEEVAEAVAMAGYLRDVGVPEEAILIEDRARTTRENLVFAKALLEDPSAPVVVATSNYHTLRAALLAREVGLRAKVVGGRVRAYFLPSATLREFAAILLEHKWVHLALIGLYAALLVMGYLSAAA